MQAIQYALVLLCTMAVGSFHVPLPLSVISRSIVPCSARQHHLLLLSAERRGRGIEPEEPLFEGPILLPPADYTKPGRVVNLGDDDGAEVGHVMLNRKITLSFTCNVCDGHNTHQINRVSFMQGIVVLWCQHCNQKHLIADNLGKLDFPEFGRNLEEFMAKKGTPVKRVVMDRDGLSHVQVAVPGKDYPEVNPHQVTRDEDEEEALREGFDAMSLLPSAHVGGADYLRGVPPPPPPPPLRQEVGGAGDGEDVVDGEWEGDVVDGPPNV
ncbi:unnamed protein product [Ectocarpus sp. CCAP 1310/34]|nr:unnamed protein product [Ectocarpus sp. CCAP 1310/34]